MSLTKEQDELLYEFFKGLRPRMIRLVHAHSLNEFYVPANEVKWIELVLDGTKENSRVLLSAPSGRGYDWVEVEGTPSMIEALVREAYL